MAKQSSKADKVAQEQPIRLSSRAQREERYRRWTIIGSLTISIAVIGLLGFAFINQYYLEPNHALVAITNDKITVKQYQDHFKYTRARLIISGQIDPTTDQTTIAQYVLDQMIAAALIRRQAAEKAITVSDADIERQIQLGFGYEGGVPAPTATPSITPQPIVGTPTATSTFVFTLTPVPTSTLEPGITPTFSPTHTPTALITPSPVTESSATSDSAAVTTIPATEVPTSTATVAPTLIPTFTPAPTSTPLSQQDFDTAYNDYIDQISKISGLVANQVKTQMNEDVRTQLLQEKLLPVLAITIDKTKPRIHAAHILVTTSEEAQKISDRLAAGEEFEKLAATLSQDQGSAYRGGDLGWFDLYAPLVQEFKDAAFATEPGQISKPTQTNYGWHVIKVYERVEVPTTPDDQEKQRQDQFASMLKQWRTDANVIPDVEWVKYIPTLPAP